MKKLFAVLLLSLVGTSLGAAEAPRVFKFLSTYQGPEPEVMMKSLEASLLRSMDRLLLVPLTDEKPDLSTKALKNMAQRKSCDGILAVALKAVGKTWEISVKVFRPGDEEPLFAKNYVRDQVPLQDLAEIFWLFLLGDLDTFLTQRGKEIPKPLEALTSHVTVKGAPGTLVTGLVKDPLTIPEKGEISADVNYPGSYFILASHPEYRTKPAELFLLDPEKVITLDQVLEKRVTVNVYLFNFTFPSLEAQWFVPPGTWYVKLGLEQYFFGFNFQGTENPSKDGSLFQGMPLMNVYLGTGFYFTQPQDPVKWYAGLNVGVRLMTELQFGPETTAPLYFQPYTGVEYRPVDLFGLYFDFVPKIYAPLVKPKLWNASAQGPGQFLINNFMGLELLALNVGARWYLW